MKKIYLLLVLFIFISINAYSQDNTASMVKSMQIEDVADISISDENSTMTFQELAENYASIIMNKNATPDQLEALGSIIKLWMDTLAANYTRDEMFKEYSRITSTLSCMSIHLILRIAIKDNNIPTESAQNNIYNSISKVSLENFLESLLTIFKSENGEISFILSKEKFLEYYSYPYSMYFSELENYMDNYSDEDNKNNCYFKSGSSKLNKFIEESIKNDMGGEYPFSFGCSFFKNKFVFSYGGAVEYRIMMFIIDMDTLFLMEVPYNHNENQKYGFNGIFKRQQY